MSPRSRGCLLPVGNLYTPMKGPGRSFILALVAGRPLNSPCTDGYGDPAFLSFHPFFSRCYVVVTPEPKTDCLASHRPRPPGPSVTHNFFSLKPFFMFRSPLKCCVVSADACPFFSLPRVPLCFWAWCGPQSAMKTGRAQSTNTDLLYIPRRVFAFPFSFCVFPVGSAPGLI